MLAFPWDALRLISTLGHRESVLATAGREGLARSAAPAIRVGTSGELPQYTSAPPSPSKFSPNRPATRFAFLIAIPIGRFPVTVWSPIPVKRSCSGP